jgi:mortality factor 4-like protein 1
LLHTLQMDDASVSSSSMLPLTPPPFQVDEKVYCRDKNNRSGGGGKGSGSSSTGKHNPPTGSDSHMATAGASPSSGPYYEAVIRKIRLDNMHHNEQENQQWSFLVHYAGWNSRWDRWLSSSDILKDNEETRALLLKQRKAMEKPNSSNNTSSCQKHGASSALSSTKVKRSRTNATRLSENKASSHAPMSSNSALLYADYCELPFTLQTVLMDEYDLICAQRHTNSGQPWLPPTRLVHHLPASVTIRKVLAHFCKSKIKECRAAAAARALTTSGKPARPNAAAPSTAPAPTLTPDIVESFCDDLAQLFRKALPVCLLYPQERPQYHAVSRDPYIGAVRKMDVTELYGCEHLLRLYVRLPVLLQASLSQNSQEDNRQKLSVWSLDPTVVGPLLSDLLVLLQKNRSTLFSASTTNRTDGGHTTESERASGSVTANYRVLRPEEWLDWERHANMPNTTDTDASMKSHGKVTDVSASTDNVHVPVDEMSLEPHPDQEMSIASSPRPRAALLNVSSPPVVTMNDVH